MIVKAQQICTDAMRLAGYIAGNRTPSEEDSQIAFMELAGLIDLWHTEKLMNVSVKEYLVTSALSVLRIGNDPSYELNLPYPPVGIASASVRRDGLSLSIRQMNSEQVTGMSLIDPYNSDIPEWYTYQPGADYGTLALYPSPSSSITIALSIEEGLPIPADLGSNMALTPGWYQTLKYCLADLIVIPLGVPQDAVTQALTAKASSFKSRLKSARARVIPIAPMELCLAGYRRNR
jgi:hypothetical protein